MAIAASQEENGDIEAARFTANISYVTIFQVSASSYKFEDSCQDGSAARRTRKASTNDFHAYTTVLHAQARLAELISLFQLSMPFARCFQPGTQISATVVRLNKMLGTAFLYLLAAASSNQQSMKQIHVGKQVRTLPNKHGRLKPGPS